MVVTYSPFSLQLTIRNRYYLHLEHHGMWLRCSVSLLSRYLAVNEDDRGLGVNLEIDSSISQNGLILGTTYPTLLQKESPVLLDSAAYMLFLMIVVIAYWNLEWRYQNWLLLVASYSFYAWWDWRFLILMASSTVVDYFSARLIARSNSTRVRDIFFIASLILTLCILGYFKYFNFFADSFVRLASSLGLLTLSPFVLKVILPPAISFYTFQEVAYLVDVYQRKLEPAHSWLDYALFISFFPHLIAGPIQRPGHLLPQVQRPRSFDPKLVYDGCMLILTGLFRKCVVADSCAQLANAAFEGRFGHTGWATFIGSYAFAFQIYGDFSGYSDIARGSAQLLGFHFMVNFRQPYLATTLQDFWRRWHISLSTWLRDYIYFPLGGSRSSAAKTYLNLLSTMLIGGLWHGASWNFIVWGGMHGGGLAFERLFSIRRERNHLQRWFSRVMVFHLVCLAWVFFRAANLRASFDMLAALRHWQWLPIYSTVLLTLATFALPVLVIDFYLERTAEEYPTQHASFGWQLSAASIAVFAVAFASANQSAPFVYFQF
jgi:alginate O-acetyltransferase complex protein AlgI